MILESIVTLILVIGEREMQPIEVINLPPPCVESSVSEIACYPIDDSGKDYSH